MISPVQLEAPLTCPACGITFTGHWTAGHETAIQHCPDGHASEATWPGFHFEPRRVTAK